MKDRFTDRRRHARIPMVSIVHIWTESSGQSLPCMLVDLSAGGARVLSQNKLTTGETVKIDITVNENKVIEIIGLIVWVKEMDLMKEYNFGVEYMGGIQFTSADEEINKYVKSFIN